MLKTKERQKERKQSVIDGIRSRRKVKNTKFRIILYLRKRLQSKKLVFLRIWVLYVSEFKNEKNHIPFALFAITTRCLNGKDKLHIC